MNDTKRLKVVFLVENNKHLALARTSALFAAFNLIAICNRPCELPNRVRMLEKMHHSEAEN